MDPPCVRIIKRPLSGLGLGHVTHFRIFDLFLFSKFLDTPNNFWTNRAIRFKFGRTKPTCVRTIKRPLNGRGLGHVTQVPIFGTPNNFWTNRDIRFKFGTDIEDGPSMRMDYKTAPEWAWLGSRDPIPKFWAPNNFWTNRAIRFKFDTDIWRTLPANGL